MSSAPAQRLRMIVRGRVQGVFFRASAAGIAKGAGLHGFARNLADGSVEIVAEGPRSALEQLLAWARRGPSGAHVDQVLEQWGEPTGAFGQFEIR